VLELPIRVLVATADPDITDALAFQELGMDLPLRRRPLG
jgi:hypothetical protein